MFIGPLIKPEVFEIQSDLGGESLIKYHLGFEILAVGTTLSILLNACAQAWILKSDLNFELNFYLNIRLVKILLSGITTFFLVYFVKTQIHFLEFNFLIRCGFLFGYLVVIALCYFGFCAALGERELFKQILAKFIRKNS